LLLRDVHADKSSLRREHLRVGSCAAADFEDFGLRWEPSEQFVEVAKPRITPDRLLPRGETISDFVVAVGDDLLASAHSFKLVFGWDTS
jgi:hypothetical protein